MSKTQTKMELVDTSESTEFKKTRMKEVRAMVSNALKKNRRIDLMDFTGTDIPRVMVALQDEVMDARNRHAKATKHISSAKQTVNIILPVVESVMETQAMHIQKLEAELEIQSERVEDAHEYSISLHQENEKLRNTVDMLR
ncbi:hypothetical protein PP753_gp30 [Dinoroseobacter phage vB_DshP-R7L]|uniref:Uncharacterized protein n=1 Tax=Dinoroseobacter phage vB_DshP-R7L TaxID=2873349 RepID=A0AAE8XBG1_9CAUD|nr:hypothetical protein PP753_gp30 [Dinoroseobacter phage vB_DshP-R7L]UAT28869.1 hypothetical protein R7L_gp30 [Dinoroseobacter phage vB_DshP-R7L]